MAYKLYLAGTLFPVAPSKVTTKINSQNQTLTLISGEEVSVLKAAGLTDVSFELLLPQSRYPFTSGTFRPADYYLSLLERLKTSQEPFQFLLIRQKPNGAALHNTNLTVSLESYDIVDDADEGFDVTAKVNLKQYRTFGTKTVVLRTASDGTATASVQASPRSTATAPKAATYTVKAGDCLWNIAKQQLGDGSRYNEIYSLNKDKIQNPNLIRPGQVLTLPS